MIARLLIYIKHNLPLLWDCVEWLNALLYKFFHAKKVSRVLQETIDSHTLSPFIFRALEEADLFQLENLLNNQSATRVAFFKPHKFDFKSLKKAYRNPSFIMMGVFSGSAMAGYFFLRCFWNKKCFVGRLIDESYDGKGIGRVMNDIMYNIGWGAGFKILSTISRNNRLVMRSHANNPAMRIIKELPGDYLLVEFVKPGNQES